MICSQLVRSESDSRDSDLLARFTHEVVRVMALQNIEFCTFIVRIVFCPWVSQIWEVLNPT